MSARLALIRIYPIKSLDGVPRDEADVLPSGALRNDRRWALVDEAGAFVNASKNAAFHKLRFSVDEACRSFELTSPSDAILGVLPEDAVALARFLTRYFEQTIGLAENAEAGLPDDPDAPGPTVVSTATLTQVAGWFDLPVEDVRRRFRANLEIDGVPAFWEDRLYGVEGEVKRFWIGGVEFGGTNPCQRCVVPSRDPQTGEVISAFAKRFGALREAELPGWAEASRFDHYYRLAVNTKLLGEAGVVRVGDEVVVEEP